MSAAIFFVVEALWYTFSGHLHFTPTIVERFIKPRSSKMFGHPVYSLDRPGPLIAVSGPHEKIFNSNFALWIGGKNFSDGCCRPIKVAQSMEGLRIEAA